jgi:hypothetical protein
MLKRAGSFQQTNKPALHENNGFILQEMAKICQGVFLLRVQHSRFLGGKLRTAREYPFKAEAVKGYGHW